MNQAIIQREYIIHWQNQITLVSFKDGDNLISYGPNNYISAHGEVAQWLGHRIANCKISSSSPALPTVLRVRDISNLSSHTVHSAECTGNCA